MGCATAGGADGGPHRPTGAAQWRLRAADGLWRRKSELLVMARLAALLPRVSRFRPPGARSAAYMEALVFAWLQTGERLAACSEILSSVIFREASVLGAYLPG